MVNEGEDVPGWAQVVMGSLVVAMEGEASAPIPPAVDLGSCLPRLLFELFQEYLTGKSHLRRELLTASTFAMNKEDPLISGLDISTRMMVWSFLKNLEAKRLQNERATHGAASQSTP